MTDAQMWGMHLTTNDDEFKAACQESLRASGLGMMGWPTETFDPRSLTRHFSMAVEPHSGQDCEPFHVAATIEFKWHALHRV